MGFGLSNFGFQQSGGGGGGGTNTNIANSDLTQDAARTLTGAGNALTFTGQTITSFDHPVKISNGTGDPTIQLLEASGSGTNTGTITCGALASDRIYTFPDNSGTVAFTSDIAVLTAGDGLTITGTEIDLDATLTTVTSIKNTSLVVGRDADNDIDFSTDNQINFRVGASDNLTLTTQGVEPTTNGGYNLGASAKRFNQVHINHLVFKPTGSTVGDAQGDIVAFGTTSVQAGKVYYWDGSNWTSSDADAVSTGTGLLGVAMATGTASSVGILVRGFVTLGATTGGSDGDVVYLDTNASRLTSTAPSGSGDVVRVCGYLIDSSNNVVWFQPDGTWVEVA